MPGVDASVAELASGAPSPSPVIGREHELAAAVRLLGDPAVRLVTLTGPGGVGKTRLAAEVAARLVGRFPDGVVLVPLASLDDPPLVAVDVAGLSYEETARSLGIPRGTVMSRLHRARAQVVRVVDGD